MRLVQFILFLSAFISLSATVYGQEIENNPQNQLRYTPSKLYQNGEYEVHFYNNYYAQKDKLNGANEFNSRTNFFTVFGQFLYGISPRLNLGIELKLRSVNQNNRMLSSTFNAFQFKNEGFLEDEMGTIGYSRVGLTAIAPRIKYQPFKDLINISFQHTLYIPLGSALEGSEETGWIDWSKPSFYTQMFYDETLGGKFGFFAELGFILENIGGALLRQNEGFYQVATPMNFIVNYFVDNVSTLYFLINASPRWGIQVNQNLNASSSSIPYSQYGAGYKLFISSKIQLEILYSRFYSNIPGQSANTFNLGIRYMGTK